MRVTSLVALVAVALTAAYFIFLTPQWATDAYLKTIGYGPAATPTEAMDKFQKAVKSRDLKTAALFCSGEFAEHLKRCAPAAKELGPTLDGISEYMKNKGLDTDKCITYVHYLDPFPTNFKTGAAPKELNADSAKGLFIQENIWKGTLVITPEFVFNELKAVDGRMFNRVAMPINLYDPKGFDIVKDGGSWKLKFPLPPLQVQAMDHFINNYKAYYTGLGVFRRDVTNDRFASKADFERELVKVMQEAK